MRYSQQEMKHGEKPIEKRRPSPEEVLGSTRHDDLPDIIPQELRDRSVPADGFNVHFEGANMHLWRHDDYLELFRFIEKINSGEHGRDSIWFADMCEMEVVANSARVVSEFEAFADEPVHFDFRDLYAYMSGSVDEPGNQKLYFVSLSANVLDSRHGPPPEAVVGIVLFAAIAGWLLYGIFLIFKWMWLLIASWFD